MRNVGKSGIEKEKLYSEWGRGKRWIWCWKISTSAPYSLPSARQLIHELTFRLPFGPISQAHSDTPRRTFPRDHRWKFTVSQWGGERWAAHGFPRENPPECCGLYRMIVLRDGTRRKRREENREKIFGHINS